MKILCDSGSVSRQEGKWTHYRLSTSGREYAVELFKKLQPRKKQDKTHLSAVRIKNAIYKEKDGGGKPHLSKYF